MKKKETKKEIKKDTKKNIKKDTKKVKKQKEKKNKEGFFKGIKIELKKVTWPSKKDILKYSIATLVFCIVVMVFFQLLDLGLSVVKGVFN